MTIHKSPDCGYGKHHACSGDAWCDTRDDLTPCACTCHMEETR